MKRIALALVLLVAAATAAFAQSTVTVIGPITPGDCPQFNSTTIIKDSGFNCNGTPAVAFANPSASVGLTAVNGAAPTAMRSDAAPPLSAAVQSALTGSNNGFLCGTGAFGFNSTATPTTPGTIAYWNGSACVILAGNTTGTQTLTENASGVPSWSASGAGSVTSLVCNGVTITTSGTCPPPYGFVNCSLAASVATNILTVALKDNSGADPTATSPCNMYFRNVTPATGSWTQITQTAALSITTNATGATLGSVNNTAFRFWVAVFNNGGTPVLALINCSTAGNIFPLNESLPQSSTAISASATSAGVFYSPNGTTVSSKTFLVLGYVEYNSTGLATAGTYATAPNFIQTLGPGVHKPGEIVQLASTSTSSSGTSTSATFVALSSGMTIAVTPTSAANLIYATTTGTLSQSAASGSVLQLSRGTTAATNLFGAASQMNVTASSNTPINVIGFDFPNTTSSTTYAIQGKTTAGTVSYPSGGDTAVFFLQEIMG
jgi:hypothetical protein